MTSAGHIIPWVLCAIGSSVVCTLIVRYIALRYHIVDRPDEAPERKVHRVPMPLLGGIAPWAAFSVTILLVCLFQPDVLLGGYLLPKYLVGIILGGGVLMIGGARDDIRRQSPLRQILWPMLAAVVVIGSGIGITYLSNPFGSPIRLDQWQITVATVGGVPYQFVLLADLFAWAWLMVMMYTTKFLDGLDGLVSGITIIGMVILCILSVSASVGQPETAFLALIGAASFFGFLFFNVHPARIFLGEGGSLWAGFLLGTLAIISGGKIATALLILGVPMLDVLWVVFRRLLSRPASIARADRTHLHFRLLDIGFSHRQAVTLLYVFSAIFGSATLFTEGRTKLFVLFGVVVAMVLLGVVLLFRSKKRPAGSVDTDSQEPYTGQEVIKH